MGSSRLWCLMTMMMGKRDWMVVAGMGHVAIAIIPDNIVINEKAIKFREMSIYLFFTMLK
jgi:hypothetical protein